MRKENIAFVDLETTGLDPERHEIIEIGAIIARQEPRAGRGPEVRVVEEFDIKVKPERIEEAERSALRTNKYSEAEWLFAADLEQALRAFAPKISGAILAGQNIGFDIAFLERAFARFNMPFDVHHHKIDVVSIAFTKYYHDESWQRFGLRTLCERLGVKNEKAHSALSDIRATFEVYKKLLDA